ncbi:MAG: bifunctional glutamate N-acetyltransferase/amino-acid acetyltransferase ArgJ [Deltaproteobacteria bacterium]|nr:bifunctional glutamate N-acetyltransferase/amino-acid acetyltransferase ArgJ [Deltaproteobacteria bacterium]
MKKNLLKDFGLIFSEKPAVAAGVFTSNWVKAAPLLLTREHLHGNKCQAVLVNSGNANACTGKEGMADAECLAEETARLLEIDPELVAVASTGVIGERLPVKKMLTMLPALCQEMGNTRIEDFARAIMTTDNGPKISTRSVNVEGTSITVAGIAKGAGMINPSMATMLVFILTDASVRRRSLQAWVKEAADRTFNRITVDGDTSTNDMVLVLANGYARNRLLSAKGPGALRFREMLFDVMNDLARKIIQDGEGATKLIEVRVEQAKSVREADTIARSVANSPLVKTSFFGEEVNWGRIIAAAGKTAFPISFEKIDLFINGIPLVEKGVALGAKNEKRVQKEVTKKEIIVTLTLHQGTRQASVLTTDFSYDYIKINAGYRT